MIDSAALHRYIEKPIVILAMQFTGDNGDDVQAFVGKGAILEHENGNPGNVLYVEIRTAGRGHRYAFPGDYIILGRREDDFYPCAPGIFEDKYELADDAQ